MYGNTSFKKKLLPNYTNLNFSKIFFRSSSKVYVKKFLDIEKIKKSNLIEIHNRPDYINSIYEINNNIVLYFHNNPLDIKSSKTFCLFILVPAKCHFFPYSPPPRKLATA